MGLPLSTSVLVIFGLLISLCFHRVKSQDGSRNLRPPRPQIAPPPPPPPPSPSPPPPPSPPPSPPPPSPRSPPPLVPPPPRNPPKQLNSRSESNGSPPPMPRHPRPFRRHHRAPPPPRHHHRSRINAGKKVGLLFSGIAAILQIGVISFLVFKRRQLLKVNNRYESCS